MWLFIVFLATDVDEWDGLWLYTVSFIYDVLDIVLVHVT